MKANNNQIFKHKMVKLLRIFNKYPFMFVDFLEKHNALSQSFKKKVISSYIRDKKESEYIDIAKLLNYYDNILTEDKDTNLDLEYWNNNLKIAINEQRFEDAAKIRDKIIFIKNM